jgi:hypothetical protein
MTNIYSTPDVQLEVPRIKKGRWPIYCFLYLVGCLSGILAILMIVIGCAFAPFCMRTLCPPP